MPSDKSSAKHSGTFNRRNMLLAGTTLAAPFERVASANTPLDPNSPEFGTWQGGAPGTLNLSFLSKGGISGVIPANFVIGQRAFTTGELTVTYTFVPEPASGFALGAAMLGLLGWSGRRLVGKAK